MKTIANSQNLDFGYVSETFIYFINPITDETSSLSLDGKNVSCYRKKEKIKFRLRLDRKFQHGIYDFSQATFKLVVLPGVTFVSCTGAVSEAELKTQPSTIKVEHLLYNSIPTIYITENHPLIGDYGYRTLFEYQWGSSKPIPQEFIKDISWSAEEVEQGINRISYVSEYSPILSTKKFEESSPRIAFVDYNRKKISLYDKQDYTSLSYDGKKITQYKSSIELDTTEKVVDFNINETIQQSYYEIVGDCLVLKSIIDQTFSINHNINSYKVANEGDLLLSEKLKKVRTIRKEEIVLKGTSFENLIFIIQESYAFLLKNMKKVSFSFGKNWFAAGSEFLICWENQQELNIVGSCAARRSNGMSFDGYGEDGNKAQYSETFATLASYAFDATITQDSVISVVEQKNQIGTYSIEGFDLDVKTIIQSEKSRIAKEQSEKEAEEFAAQEKQIRRNIATKVAEELHEKYFGAEVANDWDEFMLLPTCV